MLRAGGLHWPCPPEDHPGATILHGESVPVGKKVAATHNVTSPYRDKYTLTPEYKVAAVRVGETLRVCL